MNEGRVVGGKAGKGKRDEGGTKKVREGRGHKYLTGGNGDIAKEKYWERNEGGRVETTFGILIKIG